MTDNLYVIDLRTDQKIAARQLLDRIPTYKCNPFSEYGNDHTLDAVAAGYLFSTHPLFKDMAAKIRDVSDGKTPGICIHGFPLGKLGVRFDKSLDTSQLENNPSQIGERGSQLLYAMTGLIGLIPNEHLAIKQVFSQVYWDSNTVAKIPERLLVKHKLLDKDGYPKTDRAAIDNGQVLHKHMHTLLIGIHSSSLDVEGNNNNPTTIFSGDGKPFLSEPIKRGTVMIIGNDVDHSRPPALKNTSKFQRLLLAITFPGRMPLPKFSEVEIEKFISTNFAEKQAEPFRK